MAGAFLVGAGMVGCDGANADPEPEPPTTQPEEPETPDSEQTAAEPEGGEQGPQDYAHPQPGPEIEDDGQAGAEAAAVYFVELFSYIHATGDFEAWDELTTENCNFCRGVREQVSGMYADGGYASAQPPVVDSVFPHVWDRIPGDYSVEVVFLSPELVTFDSDGEVIERFHESRTRAWFVVEHRDDGWVVVGADGGDLQ
ncbi:DUF6318 family protein [Pseudactinotalea sp. Z1748]|uniref:DUF6318 family protein n=1 Tax=Pseudactinotalea sp. Z1748 TaxID=3413027 RepID=UPI003C7C8D05